MTSNKVAADDASKAKIVKQLTALFIKLIPDVTHRAMYGGTVFELNKDDPKSLIGGIFSYKEHVSLELSKGASLKDVDGVLEGKGKFRRHVKLYAVGDIKTKGCEQLISQSFQQS